MEKTGTKIKAPAWQPTPASKQNQSIARSPQLPEGINQETQTETSHEQDHYGEPKAGAILNNVAASVTAPPTVSPAPQPVSVPQNIQPKLTIGAPGDKYEQEADQVAEQVVQRLQASSSAGMPGEGDGGNDRVQRKPQLTVAALNPQPQETTSSSDNTRPRLQCQRQTGATEASPDFESALNRTSGGQSLASPFRLQAENLMGADFSGVKVHTDGAADQLNRSIQAKAFTNKQDIFFRQGEYNPANSEGQKLLAHELTHVMQQNSGTVRRKEEGNGAISLSSASQSMIQTDKNHLQVPSAQNDFALKDAMPPVSGPQSNELVENSSPKVPRNNLEVPPVSDNNKPAVKDAMPSQASQSSANAPSEDDSQDSGLQELEEANLFDDSANDEVPSNESDSEDEDITINIKAGLDAEEIITIKTIKENLKSTGTSYKETEIAAMAIEKLYYTFEEDKSYVDQLNGMTSEDIEIAKEENKTQLESINKQLKNQPKQQDQSESESNLEEKERLIEEKYRLTQANAYLSQMKGEKQSKNEVLQAELWTRKAKKYMADNYQRRSQVGVIYEEVKVLREDFATSSKKASEDYQKDKGAARAISSNKASEAAEISRVAKDDAAELKKRKVELINEKRVAPDFSEAKMKWAMVKGPAAAKTKVADFSVGLVSGGYAVAKAEKDKRGFQKSINITTVRAESQKACEQIQRERKALDAIKGDGTIKVVFPLADGVVSILQACDRGIWTGMKRMIRFIKLYISALSAIPVVGPVFAAIASVLSVMSGVISGLQALSNVTIVAIRGLQIWKEDPRLANMLGMSIIDSGLRGFTASLKEALFGLDQGGQMDILSNENVNVSSGNETIDNEIESELNEAVIAESVVKVTKPLSKELAKNNNKAFKLGTNVKKGKLVADLSDESIPKPDTLAAFKKAMASVLEKTSGFTAQTEPFSTEVGKRGVELKAANQNAANNAKNDPDTEESLNGIEESGSVMEIMGAALKDVVEVVEDK